ncbi:MAG: hypothetical protein QXW58_06045, partial [Thermosphaera sp.]
MMGVSIGVVSYLSSTNPIQRAINYELNKLIPNQELDPSSLIELYLRGHISLEELKSRVRVHGFNEFKTEEFLKLTKRIFTIDQAIYGFRRGIIGEDEFKAIMKFNGIPESEIPKY